MSWHKGFILQILFNKILTSFDYNGLESVVEVVVVAMPDGIYQCLRKMQVGEKCEE